MTKKINLKERRAKGLETAMTPPEAREPLEFEFYGNKFTTVSRIPITVIHRTSALGDADISQHEQLDSLIKSVQGLLIKSDRDRFYEVLDDEGVDTEELLNLFAVLLEELTGTPFEQSSSAAPGSKKTTKRSVETL